MVWSIVLHKKIKIQELKQQTVYLKYLWRQNNTFEMQE